MLHSRLQAIISAREDDDIFTLVNLLRSGLVRNLGNIATSRLYNRAYAGTKLLIEDYITQVALAVEYVAAYPTSQDLSTGLTSQAKLDLLHDTRQAFGRSALVLQGGAVFGLCHIGVVKALHLRGLLPRIIVGSDTGALIAALVGVHTEDELLNFLTGETLDLSAFSSSRRTSVDSSSPPSWLSTLTRRLRRFLKHGYLLDVAILEAAVRANVADLTFEEAYARTKRVLNITLPTPDRGDIPGLLNYLTAPNVLIWSAAVASNSASSPLYSSTALLCKDAVTGRLYTWPSPTASPPPTLLPSPSAPTSPATEPQYVPTPSYRPRSTPVAPASSADPLRDSPLTRIAELFNVNHFILSQARPSIAPFLYSESASHASAPPSSISPSLTTPLLRLVNLELQHRLRQLDSLGLLHTSIRRYLVDEQIPAASITLVPELHARDFIGLLETPTQRVVERWISRGERSVWPAVSALRVRCAVEVELDRWYQVVRRRKPLDVVSTVQGVKTPGAAGDMGEVWRGPGGDGRDKKDKSLRGDGRVRKRSRSGSYVFASERAEDGDGGA